MSKHDPVDGITALVLMEELEGGKLRVEFQEAQEIGKGSKTTQLGPGCYSFKIGKGLDRIGIYDSKTQKLDYCGKKVTVDSGYTKITGITEIVPGLTSFGIGYEPVNGNLVRALIEIAKRIADKKQ